jgi:hypothetical protein
VADIEDIKKMQSLFKQIESSEGWYIDNKTMNLSTSYYIFMSNYNKLKSALELFNRKEVRTKIWAIKNRDKLDLFQREVICLFHNYLAAAKSLVEHTRIVARELYEGKEFFNEYKSKVKNTFGDSTLSHFIQDFRNYILHVGIPQMMARLSFNGSEETNSILLDLSNLKTWDGWSPKGRDYLDGLKKNVNLYEVITGYYSLVNDFYNWFLARQEELHVTEFAQFRELREEYNKLSFKLFPEQGH